LINPERRFGLLFIKQIREPHLFVANKHGRKRCDLRQIKGESKKQSAKAGILAACILDN
jgi:hypothetical protein